MTGFEIPAELQKKIEEAGPIDLLVGIAGAADTEALRAKAARLAGTAEKIVIAHPRAADGEEPEASVEGISLVACPTPAPANALAFWADVSAAQKNILALAAAWPARACVVIHSDLAALDAETMRSFTEPVLQGKVDLTTPVYPLGKYDGLINKSLLAPLSRALYGRRVRTPLAYDFCAGASVAGKLAYHGSARAQDDAPLLWPANVIAMSGGKISQAAVNVHHAMQSDGLDLSAALAALAGSLFQEAETCAAYWQRVRGSQPTPQYGDCVAASEDSQPVDARPMVESFALGSRNLEEVWRLVLPPATVLDLKRLARLDAAAFRMSDALWARILYDFALAHRMRRVSRTHVLGALTPLYLGWVASYTQEVSDATTEQADLRIEQLARAFEEEKPYFVARWRWPERTS